MKYTLLLLGLVLPGVIAGIYAGVALGDVRIADLDGRQYAAMHQARDKTFGRVMPVLGFGLVAVLAANALVAGSIMRATAFGLACLAETGDIAMAIVWQVPRNKAVRTWGANPPIIAWREIRDDWGRTHRLRTWLGLSIFVLAAIAAVG